jgi:formylglycine-generating enzyme required for sulfatase activity
MRVRRHIALTAIVLGSACSGEVAPARDQWRVHLATDAPVPQLGEQLVAELLDDAGNLLSPDSRRLIDASQASHWPLSFGVVPDRPTARPRLRVRLYRLEETGGDGLPAGNTLIDATATLPPASGLTDVALTLAMACFSVPSQPAQHLTCDPTTGSLGPEPILAAGIDPRSLPAPGSWPPAAVVPCPTTPPQGMVCVPGGVFLLGSVHYPSIEVGKATPPLPQRLVQLHPFAMDRTEVDAGVVSDLAKRGLVPAPSCAADAGSPARCVPWTTANAVCHELGKRLPTEAEWEYAARNLQQESPYPWGWDTNVCAHAVVARAFDTNGDPLQCQSTPTGTLPFGPVATADPYDVSTPLGILHLGGNVSEWVADQFDPYDGPCWSGATLHVDPRCDQASSGMRSVRGGSWNDVAASASSVVRKADAETTSNAGIGFRCAVTL